jgi:putative hydrolase of the HAD superfamily
VDAVTVDAFGTLVSLVDPVPALAEALRRHGVERADAEIAEAFSAEASYYAPRSLEGRDSATLADLRRRCAQVFLDALAAELDAAAFAPDYVAALTFEPISGARDTLGALTRRGLALAVVSNWDCALPVHLRSVGLAHFFKSVVTSAEAGAAKPDPAIFRLALTRLGAEPGRTVHVGDGPADALGAANAGLRFVAAPLASAFAGWA